MINSQLDPALDVGRCSISKGMGDQFSAASIDERGEIQYIKGDG